MAKAKKRGGRGPLAVKRLPVTLTGDDRRVIARFFDPGGEARIRRVVERVDRLSDTEVSRWLGLVSRKFGTRHSNIAAVFERHHDTAMLMIGETHDVTPERRALTGSYFTMEYSIESAALFNPSIVRHWDQGDLPDGDMRFILSLRATGEGHVSSIVFRTGVIGADHEVRIDPPARFSHPIGIRTDKLYSKPHFRRKLTEMAVRGKAVDPVLDRVGDSFTMVQLEDAITAARAGASDEQLSESAIEAVRWLARSNYQLELPHGADPAEMVIFPQTSNESRGIEDLRMVRFVDDDGSVTYYGTCSAYDGFRVLPQLIETTDFLTIGVHTLNGPRVQAKGMALFPRRIGGNFVMCSRIDGENLYIMRSDIVQFWESAQLLQTPAQPWEFVQIGNCGSPLETPEGWLLLTHGVGPMRTYAIGAMLLDLDDPLKVIGILEEPLIMPTEKERDGYVPNVVYTCGAIIHDKLVYIPFAMSDTASRFATIPLDRLLDRLVS
jgi:predicted GH43/DUF377 family glycosyl hydrolase